MDIVVLIKSGNIQRLEDGIRLAIGLMINHKISILITDKGTEALSKALENDAFKTRFLESLDLIKAVPGIIKAVRPVNGINSIAVISLDELTAAVLNADSVVVW